jgi:uncharacterized repeat protein (TIGR01451 family)
LAITTYPTGYKPIPSTLIQACSNTLTVGAFPNPALVQTANVAPPAGTTIQNPAACPANSAALAPANQATTQYYYTFTINPAASANLVNNHLPIDPMQSGDIIITKTTPLVNVHIGQLVPYTITVHNVSAASYGSLDILDILPPGFKYKTGSATLDGARLEPTINGRNMTWTNQALAAGATKTFKMMLVVGAGVQQGEYTNTAEALDSLSALIVSNAASATVRVIPDPLFDCSEIIGKVFDDKNANGYEDQGEPGIPNVRVVTVNGLLVTTDAEGRFHVACAQVPDPERGSNFVMKLDERTLPSGYRVTTENPRDVRLTRGKMSKLNFGAAIHRVVRIDMRDDAFEEGSTRLKREWAQQANELPEKLKLRPSVLRICYSAGDEDMSLARKRLKEVAATYKKIWQEKNCCQDLVIEEEFVAKSSQANKGVK